MESVTREVEDLDKNGSFFNSGTCAQLTLLVSIPSSAGPQPYPPPTISSFLPGTFGRGCQGFAARMACSLDGLQSGWISEDFSYTQVRLLDTSHTHL